MVIFKKKKKSKILQPVINCFVIVVLTYSFISILLITVFLHPSSQEILQTKVKGQIIC